MIVKAEQHVDTFQRLTNPDHTSLFVTLTPVTSSFRRISATLHAPAPATANHGSTVRTTKGKTPVDGRRLRMKVAPKAMLTEVPTAPQYA